MIISSPSHFLQFLSPRRRRRRRDDRLSSLIALVSTLAILPIGFHLIVLNVPSAIIRSAIRFRGYPPDDAFLDIIWSFVVSCQSIGAFVGCFLVVPLERRYGTKRSLLLLNNLLLICASLCFLAISPGPSGTAAFTLPLLIIGRLLVGLYTGIGCALVPIYIQELAPPSIKGRLCCLIHIAICAGSAVGALLSTPFMLGTPSRWTLLLSAPLFAALGQIAIGQFVPETPNFFLRRCDERKAAESIRFHYNLDRGMDPVDAIIHYHHTVPRLPPQLSIKTAFADAKIRRQLLLGMLVSMAQIFSGSMAAVSYSTEMLNSVSFAAWLTPFIPTFGSLLSVLMTLPAFRFVESCGRKQLLVNTLSICAVVNFLLLLFSLLAQFLGDDGASSGASWPSIVFAACLLVYGIGYNVGIGPVAYFLPAELVPASAVSAAMGAATAVNWLSSMLTTIVFYPLNKLVGGWSFALFAVPTMLAAFFFHMELGDSPPQLEVDDGIMIKKSTNYCNGNDGSRGEGGTSTTNRTMDDNSLVATKQLQNGTIRRETETTMTTSDDEQQQQQRTNSMAEEFQSVGAGGEWSPTPTPTSPQSQHRRAFDGGRMVSSSSSSAIPIPINNSQKKLRKNASEQTPLRLKLKPDEDDGSISMPTAGTTTTASSISSGGERFYSTFTTTPT